MPYKEESDGGRKEARTEREPQPAKDVAGVPQLLPTPTAFVRRESSIKRSLLPQCLKLTQLLH